jgi:hypothetical protein
MFGGGHLQRDGDGIMLESGAKLGCSLAANRERRSSSARAMARLMASTRLRGSARIDLIQSLGLC